MVLPGLSTDQRGGEESLVRRASAARGHGAAQASAERGWGGTKNEGGGV